MAAFGAIQGMSLDPQTSTHDLPVVAGGAGLPFLLRTKSASYLWAFFRVAGPLIDRLAQMGGTTIARAVALIKNPEAAAWGHAWAAIMYSAHQAALELHASFTPADLLAPSPLSSHEATSFRWLEIPRRWPWIFLPP